MRQDGRRGQVIPLIFTEYLIDQKPQGAYMMSARRRGGEDRGGLYESRPGILSGSDDIAISGGNWSSVGGDQAIDHSTDIDHHNTLKRVHAVHGGVVVQNNYGITVNIHLHLSSGTSSKTLVVSFCSVGQVIPPLSLRTRSTQNHGPQGAYMMSARRRGGEDRGGLYESRPRVLSGSDDIAISGGNQSSAGGDQVIDHSSGTDHHNTLNGVRDVHEVVFVQNNYGVVNIHPSETSFDFKTLVISFCFVGLFGRCDAI
ncbi:hypothetical protein GYMLUDRAFT_262174 [Collybiopsis luxurians FD-317 M1]|uniref:Uncharacterized protein n=1 Tax=Collybiopsis luxurians FD-317 M1 TaxID=944289 RepID=A0A0D0BUD2_9AGAR|nr:hypothetical protein GYMLUDRAFT_262174 [Collybiopsis luxurians FD-317 M1]